MNAKRLEEKDPGETVVLCFDFTDDIEDSDSPSATITGTPSFLCTVDQSLRRGTDPAASSMPTGSPEVEGKRVFQAVTAGRDAVDYKVRCAVNINSTPATVLYKTSILPVRVQ